MGVADNSGIGQRQGLVGGQKIEAVVGKVVRPDHRTIVGIGRRGRQRERGLGSDRCDRGLLRWRQRRSDVVMVGILVSERGEMRADRRTIGQVDIGKGDAAAGVIGMALLVPARSMKPSLVAVIVGMSLVPVTVTVTVNGVVTTPP